MIGETRIFRPAPGHAYYDLAGQQCEVIQQISEKPIRYKGKYMVRVRPVVDDACTWWDVPAYGDELSKLPDAPSNTPRGGPQDIDFGAGRNASPAFETQSPLA